MGKSEEKKIQPLSEKVTLSDRELMIYKLGQLDLQVLLWDEAVLPQPDRQRVMELLAEQMHLRLMLAQEENPDDPYVPGYAEGFNLRFWDGAIHA